MPDTLYHLIRDTVTYLQDPLLPKHPLLIDGEDLIFFQKKITKKPACDVSPLTLKIDPLALPVKREEKEQHKPQERKNPIKATLEKIAPSLKLVDQIPSDTTAKRIANAWKEKIPDIEVVLLACELTTETLEFLKGLAKAIDAHLAKVKILVAEKLEKQQRWDLFLNKNNLRLIIASDGIQKFPELIRFYKSIPANSQFFLDKTPFLPLDSTSVYKSVENKAALWKTLCRMLKK
jgi:hypothetical protein